MAIIKPDSQINSNAVVFAGSNAPLDIIGGSTNAVSRYLTRSSNGQLQWQDVDSNYTFELYTIPPTAYGSVSGYVTGGYSPVSPLRKNTIEKFSFSADGNATDIADLALSVSDATGQSSTENGYSSGGTVSPYNNIIQKFPFASDGNASDVGDLTREVAFSAGQSGPTHGYTSGGIGPPGVDRNIIDKFPFAADGAASDVGDLTQSRYSAAGQSSDVSGYSSGGLSPPYVNTIDKFPFSADSNATDVGDLTSPRSSSAGQSSDINAYTSGGVVPGPTSPTVNTIDKFPFAADGNATDIADLSLGRGRVSGQSSTAYGYSSGGTTSPPNIYRNIIDKFSFASDGNATDVGDLTEVKNGTAGQQH